ncbi:hypothetical protein AXG93_2852s1060 [Marchantia polymorpha subsp. ruderalis]|uniref:Uncharacterized protein n=1 Tax=Marchantia polymorpha subsp. ruderalis TaxID=1480154 RepID=A0A176WJR0_MARPO|nr:hypothetical protein AXG93_2852s1060 [Marchantia polymorpha subsp. ruderalis]
MGWDGMGWEGKGKGKARKEIEGEGESHANNSSFGCGSIPAMDMLTRVSGFSQSNNVFATAAAAAVLESGRLLFGASDEAAAFLYLEKMLRFHFPIMNELLSALFFPDLRVSLVHLSCIALDKTIVWPGTRSLSAPMPNGTQTVRGSICQGVLH